MVPTSAFTSAQRLTLVASPWSQQWLVFKARFQIRHVHHRANICAAALSCHASVVHRVLLSASKYQNLAHDSCWFSCVSMQSSFWFPLWGLCMCLFGRKMSHVAQASMKLIMEARLSLDSYCTLSNCQNHRCRGICGAFLFPSPSPHTFTLWQGRALIEITLSKRSMLKCWAPIGHHFLFFGNAVPFGLRNRQGKAIVTSLWGGKPGTQGNWTVTPRSHSTGEAGWS